MLSRKRSDIEKRVYYIFDFKKVLVLTGSIEKVLDFLCLQPNSIGRYIDSSSRARGLYYVKTVNNPNYFKEKIL